MRVHVVTKNDGKFSKHWYQTESVPDVQRISSHADDGKSRVYVLAIMNAASPRGQKQHQRTQQAKTMAPVVLGRGGP